MTGAPRPPPFLLRLLQAELLRWWRLLKRDGRRSEHRRQYNRNQYEQESVSHWFHPVLKI
jgi:hypothetical protein